MYSTTLKVIVREGVAEKLGLPLLRGNPFDLRPIESGRAEYLVGRDRLISSWREHIVSQSPRMFLLVGERGSGRSSIVRTLASQTRRSFVGQYWPMKDPVNTIIHELSIHFCGFASSGSNQKMIDDLVSNLEESTGNLPVISLDYPSSVEIAPVLSSISPILQRLRALVIVVLTPSQLSTIDEETAQLYDDPKHIENLTKDQIQDLSNRLVSRKAREKWIIQDNLLSRIHESTSGNPRDVIRLLRDLTDERRDVGAQGTLERLMRWQISDNIAEPSGAIEIQEEVEAPLERSMVSDIDVQEDADFSFSQREEESFEPIDEIDEPQEINDLLADSELYEDIEEQTDPLDDPSDLWLQDNEDEIQNEGITEEVIDTRPKTEQGTLDDFVYMQPGTEPPMFKSGSGFEGLLGRSRVAQNSQPNSEDGTPLIESISEVAPLWPNTEPRPMPDSGDQSDKNFDSKEKNDNVEGNTESSPSSVISTNSAHWSVESSMESSLPAFEEEIAKDSLFGIDDSPISEISDSSNHTTPSNSESFRTANSWEPDKPFDVNRSNSLNEAELLVISAASKREISPSDAELQARLEVGRPRLSQIYNGLHKSGFLSVRKQGRKRLFKITEAAQKLVEA